MKYFAILLSLMLHFCCDGVYAQQGVAGNYLRLYPSSLPTLCHNGDVRFDTITNALQTCYTNTWYEIYDSGTIVPISAGGTGQITAGAAFNALSPMTTLGDIVYENSTPSATRLAGNTTATNKFLTQVGNGSISAAPAWSTIGSGDVPSTINAPEIFLQTNADSPADQEMIRLDRTGGSSGAGTSNRGSALTFRDGANTTYLGALECYRDGAAINFNSHCSISVNSTGSVQTAFTGLANAMTWTADGATNVKGALTVSGSATLTVPLAVTSGGGGATSYTAYAPITGGTTSTGNLQSAGTGLSSSGLPFVSNGSSSLPSFQTLGVPGGGTGNTSVTAYAPIVGGTTTTGALQSASTGISNSGWVLTSNGASAVPTFQNPNTGGVNPVWNYTTQSGNYTAAANDYVTGTSSSTQTITLPTAASIAGKTIAIQHAGSNVPCHTLITLATTGGQTLAGAASASYSLQFLGETVIVISDGTNWQVLAHYGENMAPTAYTASFAGIGTPGTQNLLWSRQGAFVHITGYYTTGTVTGSTFTMSLPGSCSTSSLYTSIGSSKLYTVGSGNGASTGTQTRIYLAAPSSTTLNISAANVVGDSPIIAQTASAMLNSTEVNTVDISVLIAGLFP